MSEKKFRYKKGLGQNFLHDTVKIDRMINVINPGFSDVFLEIGPGSGNLTKKLAPRVKKIFAVELDKEAIEKLKAATEAFDNIEIIKGDILETDIISFVPDNTLIRVAGNIPYYITTPIIEKITACKRRVKDFFLTVQKEVGERMSAASGSKTYGSLSVYCQYHADVKYEFTINRKAFFPVPDVDSAFISMNFLKKEPLNVINEDVFFKLTRGGFEQRRKKLSNNIKRIFNIDDSAVKDIFLKCGVNENARAEDISVECFAKMSNLLFNNIIGRSC